MIVTGPMNTTTPTALSQTPAFAESDEPTAEMIAASAAEVNQPQLIILTTSEELAGGAGAMYLREIANHDLLNQQEEVLLAQRMEAARRAAARLNADEVLDEVEREALARTIEDGETRGDGSSSATCDWLSRSRAAI